jgi:hypothetical protein
MTRGFAGTPRPLFALVLDPPSPLLPGKVRAELAAGLRMIDYVIPLSGDMDDGDVDAYVSSLAPAVCVNEQAAHAESTERLVQHVWKRHGREL